MSYSLIQQPIYAASGAALVVAGQPAVLTLTLTQPNPAGAGPDVPQDLTGRAFAQQVLNPDNSIAAECAGLVIGAGQVQFTLASATIAALLAPPATAIDLTYQLVELITGGNDLILLAPFSVRAPTAGASSAGFTLSATGAGMTVRYAGAPGPAGTAGASTANNVAYNDAATQTGQTTVQGALQFVLGLLGYPPAAGGGQLDLSNIANGNVGLIMGLI